MTSSIQTRGAKISGIGENDPFAVMCNTHTSADSVLDAQLQQDVINTISRRSTVYGSDPKCNGVVTYCAARSTNNNVYFTSIYRDSDAAIDAWSYSGGQFDIKPLDRDDERVKRLDCVAVNVPREHDGIMMHVGVMKTLNSLGGMVMSPAAISNHKNLLMLELRLNANARDLSLVMPMIKPSALSSFIVSDWSSGADSASSLVLFHVCASAGLKFLTLEMIENAKKSSSSTKMTISTTQDVWNDHNVTTFITMLKSMGIVVEQRNVVAGYLLHPKYIETVSAPPPRPLVVDEQTPLFTIRRKTTGEAESFVFDASAKGRAAYKYSASKTPSTSKSSDKVVVPLLHVLRKLGRLGAVDLDIPIAMAFCQLSRLRGLFRDVSALNACTADDLERDPDLADRINRLLETVSGLGYTLPVNGKVPLEIEEIENFICALETEYAYIVQPARVEVECNGAIQYMALQELFPIGCIVLSTSVGALGGIPVAFRVVDSFYESIRSLFGGRKFSFHLVLEMLVAAAGEYIVTSFEVILDEWMGAKPIDSLPFVPLDQSNHIITDLERRCVIVQSLAGPPAYRHYSSGSFFPHIGGQSNNRLRNIAHKLASSGRLIVDTKRGLELGHAPCAAIDECGEAIAATIKAYRNAQRSIQETETPEKRAERLKTAGLRMFSSVPKTMKLICWPTVVAFSLTVKQWGHVLVDGLENIHCSNLAWEQLVLPAKTKEMLLAMATTTLRGVNTVDCSVNDVNNVLLARLKKNPRYKFRDVVDGKGSGVLFLLYGPPGTGKTLSVEALASLFGRPLYSISFAELGSSVSELEERLTDVLGLASHWGALVLLDEGDALVERRQRGQLLLNSMTGVLLRLLENFEGSLFITSNRASSFDPAALSRVTLAVRYEPLDKAGMKIVWKNSLARILCDELVDGVTRGYDNALKIVNDGVTFDLNKLSNFEGSGRSVGAVLRLAIALADQRSCALYQTVIDDALAVFQQFNADLRDEGVADGWDTPEIEYRPSPSPSHATSTRSTPRVIRNETTAPLKHSNLSPEALIPNSVVRVSPHKSTSVTRR